MKLQLVDVNWQPSQARSSRNTSLFPMQKHVATSKPKNMLERERQRAREVRNLVW